MATSRYNTSRSQLAAMALCVLSLSSCDFESLIENRPFEIIQVGNLNFMINQQNGELFEIEGKNLFELRKFEREDLLVFEKAKSLNHDSIKKLSFTVSIKYRNEKLLYKAIIEPEFADIEPIEGETVSIDNREFVPLDAEWKDYWSVSTNRVTFQFVDEDGFTVREVRISLGGNNATSFTRVTTAAGTEGTVGFRYVGEIPCSLEDFAQVADLVIPFKLVKPGVE